GEFVGLDVKAMRTQKDNAATRHLANSRQIFLRLLAISRGLKEEKLQGMIRQRDYEALEMHILKNLIAGGGRSAGGCRHKID
ncbi:MAG: hypothetical protein Q8N81_00600, partial [bacterium]|nr:hypothetical protein [bacterium]